MGNVGVIVWMPVLSMLAAMLVWWVLLLLIGKASPVAKKFNKDNSVLVWGWTVFAALAFIFMIIKSVSTPILRPVTEVAPKEVRAIIEAPELPVLKDATGQAKPKDAIKEQPPTPMVDKALKEAMEK